MIAKYVFIHASTHNSSYHITSYHKDFTDAYIFVLIKYETLF